MWLGAVASLLVLFWISHYNYLLFHSIAELVSIAVAWGVFMLVWNARRFVGSDALVLLGTAYFFVGLVDLLHTLAYKGMGIFPAGREANLATQLWIAGRYLEGFSVLAFAGLIGKPARVNRVFLVYAAATAALLAAIFAWPVFPDCFVDGAGLTPFKKISEYLICLLLAASLTILSRKRTAIDHSVFVSMAAAIGLTIVGELAFTFYVSVYGLSNLVGHFAKLASFFLVYLALIGSGLTRPYAVLFARWKQSRHDFERLVEAAPISVMGFDAQGRVTYVNPFHLQTFAAGKHGADFFIGQKIHELPGIVRAGLSEHIAKVLEGEPVFIADAYFPEFTGGHSGYQTIRAIPFVENGTVTGGILVREDATVLKRHEHRYQRALSTTSDGFWIVGPDGAIQECNQAAAAMTGYCVDELTGMHVTDIDALETPEETRRHLAALHQGHEERFETRHRRKDGSLVDVEVSVSRIPESGGQFVAFVRDITALKLSRNQLVASEEKFSRAFYSSPMLMSISSVEEGTYLEVNDAFVRATGYTRDGSIGKTSTQLGFIDAASRRTLKATLMKKRRVENLELDLVRKDGTPMVCRYWGELIRVGDQTRLLSIALDVTLEKQAEWERQAAIDLLQVLNHQSSLNELAKEVTGLMHRFSGCEAVGLRLKDGDDYPYFETSGFPLAFVQAESRLCAADGQGGVLRDSAGNPVLECMCGNVLQGRTDPRQPFFTEFGSFWSNGTSQLLASTSEAERQARTRNRCNGEGYESVALIPMRYGSETLGLLQLNDRRQNRFTLDTIQLFERLSANLAMAIKVRQDVQTLRESERRYRNLFENAPVGILESLSDGHVTDANPEMASIIGCASPDEVLQRYHNIGEKLYARPEQRAKLLEKLKADGEIKGFEFEVVSADGKTLWIRSDMRIQKRFDDGSFTIQGFLVDITGAKQIERLLEARLALSQYADSHTLEEVLKETLDQAEKLTDSRIGFFHFVEADQQTISLQMWSTNTMNTICTASDFDQHYPIAKAGVWADCVRQRKPVIHNNYAGLPRRKGLPEGHAPVVRELVVPIFRDDRIVAILGVGNKLTDYSPRDVEVVNELVDMAWDIVVRQRTEEELKTSRRDLQTLVGNLPGMAFRCLNDADWTMQYISDGCRDLTGYDPADFIGNQSLAFNDVIHPDDRQRVWDEVQAAIAAEGNYQIEYRILDSQGRQKWVWERGRYIDEFEGQIFVEGFVSDITERRETQARMQMQALVMDQIHDRVVVTDLEGRITYVNESQRRAFGYSNEDLIGQTTEVFGEDAVFGVTQKEILAGTLAERGWQGEVVNRSKSGERRIMEVRTQMVTDIDGRDIALCGIATDITERRNREEELTRLASAIDQAAESIMITDVGGKILFVNPAFEKITGYHREEVLGKTPGILKSGQHDGRFYDKLWTTLTTGHIWTGQITNRRKDGSLYIEKGRISPVFDRSGRIINFVAVRNDVTDELRLEDNLRQAQKMEAIGTLAGGIAHDFNNILFPLVGFTEMIREDLPAESHLQEYISDVLAAAMRARELVKQILAFSRQTDQERQAIQVQRILKEAVKLSRASLPSSISIKKQIDQKCLPVLADPTQIHQIAMNLITNAYHAMEFKGGTLTIALAMVDVPSAGVSPSATLPSGSYVRLQVMDTGIGIDRSILERIFEPYFTTKSDGKGTGLGLSVIHGIVASCKGDIRVESEVGRGTTFSVYLPCVQPNEDRDAADSEVVAVRGGEERILLVDDEMPIINMVSKLLTRLGYQVTTRSSSLEALDLFKTDARRFDLVITDLTMPSMTGDRLIQALKGIRAEIPVILCTGFSDKINERRAAEIGAAGLVLKPILKRELDRVIRRALEDTG